MRRDQGSEARPQLVNTLQEINQGAVKSILTTQEHHVQFMQDSIMNWIKTLKKQGENTHTLMEEMEQLSLKQQDALQKAVHEGMGSYFYFLPTSFSSYPQSLQLEATLQICLLALASRYPRHIVDINEKVLGPQSFEANGWTASDIIELFESRAPQMLQAMARLENNTQRKGIYLLERSEETPAFWIHCGEYGEKMPPYRGNLSARQEKTGTKV